MRTLVLGGTGTVGSEVVRELLKRDIDVKVLTRNKENAERLPRKVKAEIGNLLEPETLRRIFRGVDRVFLLNALSPTETHEGLMAVNGAKSAGVERIVYLSVAHTEKAPHVPHFGSKLPVETAIKKSGVEYTILRPNNFFQNDYWFRDAIAESGVYPEPIGDVGLSRVDVRDIAEAASVVLTESGHAGKTYELAGAEVLTGERVANIWSRVLNRQVAYIGNDLDKWEREFAGFFPSWLVYDLRIMYEFFQREGLKARAEDLESEIKLLGRPPRRFEDFAQETADLWLAKAAAG